MAIDSYNKNLDVDLALLRWQGLGEKGPDLLDTLTSAVCRFSDAKDVDNFRQLVSLQSTGPVGLGSMSDEPIITKDPALTDSVYGMPVVETEKSKFSIKPLLILMALTLLVGGVFAFLMIKKSKSAGGKLSKIRKSVPFSESNTANAAKQSGDTLTQKEPPLSQFMTTYRQNDDLYDDSFSIDSINGEFLGECGVGIAETIGVGEPKKVTALEVWLFDKNDIQTVTKVLMSEHANDDPAIRQRLLSKGEPVVVEPGMRFVMETASLQLEAKVVDMVYARGPLPENSYFSRLTLEISVWAK
jgi:hypothetical protein